MKREKHSLKASQNSYQPITISGPYVDPNVETNDKEK